MINILHNYYHWSDTAIQRIADRLISGDELTINHKSKKAYINYYRDATEEIPWDYAEMVTKTGLIECNSGNFETGEKHYNIRRM